jgi:hypothetical protein
MELDSYRPIITGLIGGVIATWLMARWAKNLPQTFSGKSNGQLLHEHRWAVWLANALFLAGIGIALVMYKIGGYPGTDLTPILLGFGLAGVMPVLALLAVPLARGQRPAEALYAFSVGQHSPMGVTYGILAVSAVMLPFGLYRLGT